MSFNTNGDCFGIDTQTGKLELHLLIEEISISFPEGSIAEHASTQALRKRSRKQEIVELIVYSILQINLRGEYMRQDPSVVALLRSVDRQPPFVEEFLLRHDKTGEDYQRFLAEHSDKLDQTVREFIKGKVENEIRHQHTEF